MNAKTAINLLLLVLALEARGEISPESIKSLGWKDEGSLNIASPEGTVIANKYSSTTDKMDQELIYVPSKSTVCLETKGIAGQNTLCLATGVFTINWRNPNRILISGTNGTANSEEDLRKLITEYQEKLLKDSRELVLTRSYKGVFGSKNGVRVVFTGITSSIQFGAGGNIEIGFDEGGETGVAKVTISPAWDYVSSEYAKQPVAKESVEVGPIETLAAQLKRTIGEEAYQKELGK